MASKGVKYAAVAAVAALAGAKFYKDHIEYKSYSRIDEIKHGRARGPITDGCLVLEGGALRGLYTSGVTDALMEHGINLQTVVGVSAGALNGVGYITRQIGRSARFNLSNRYNHRYFGLTAYLRNKSPFGFEYMFSDQVNVEALDWKAFNSSSRRFVAVATDVATGKPAYLEKKNVSDMDKAIRASATMPVLSASVYLDGHRYLDGGCSCNIPYQWALDEGYEQVVVIRTRSRGFHKDTTGGGMADAAYDEVAARRYAVYPNLLRALRHSDERYNRECDRLERLEERGRVFCIAPSIPPQVGRMEPDIEKLGDLYMLGHADAEAAIPALRKYLGMPAEEK